MRRLLFGLLLFIAAAPLDARAGSQYIPPASSGGQPLNATLTSISDAVCVADTLLYCDGIDSIGETTVTAFARTVLDDANAAATLVTLGTGTAAVLNVGTGANNIVQRDGAGAYPSGDGSAITGISAPAAIPALYTIITDATIDPADWVDADDIGGATSVDKESAEGGRFLGMATNRLTGGGGVSGNRAQGLLTAVAGGDFLVEVPMGFSTTSLSDAVIACSLYTGAVFVDGADLDTANWYGLAQRWSFAAIGTSISTFHVMANTAGGAGKWAAWTTATAVAGLGANFGGLQLVMWLGRSGTTLTAYISRMGGIPVPVATWTVSAGAGYVGVRAAVEDYVAATVWDVVILGYGYQASAVLPWAL